MKILPVILALCADRHKDVAELTGVRVATSLGTRQIAFSQAVFVETKCFHSNT
jgi:hypothetical protein